MRPIDPDANQFRHMASAFQDWLSDAPAGLDAPTYSQQFEAFLRRQFDPLPVGFFVGIVRDFGFQYGATMDYAAYAFVPRIIWEDKPNVTRGAWFAHYLGFARSEEQSTTSIGMTAVGELYWNFGVPGVLGGMFVIGALLSGLLWRMTGADPSLDPIRLWLYVTLMLSMADMPEAVTVLVSIVAKFILFKAILLGFRFWSLPARREYAILPAR